MKTGVIGVKVSAAIIAWNEADNIDLCLRSLKGYADEVVIADTGSFDGTIYKAEQWLDKLDLLGEVTSVTIRSLDQARRAAIEKCTNPWIQLVDANIAFSEGLKRELRQAIEKGRPGMVRSLNLMGDYEHYFTPLQFHSHHNVLFPCDKIRWRDNWDYPLPVKGRITLNNWAVSLSRVRPAWRYWLRGEPFKPETGREWRTPGNRQSQWQYSGSKYNSLLEYVEAEEGLTLEDVKRIAPDWVLDLLRRYAAPLKESHRQGLPEVIREEQKNPRYRLIYEGDEIVGRWPEL